MSISLHFLSLTLDGEDDGNEAGISAPGSEKLTILDVWVGVEDIVNIEYLDLSCPVVSCREKELFILYTTPSS